MNPPRLATRVSMSPGALHLCKAMPAVDQASDEPHQLERALALADHTTRPQAAKAGGPVSEQFQGRISPLGLLVLVLAIDRAGECWSAMRSTHSLEHRRDDASHEASQVGGAERSDLLAPVSSALRCAWSIQPCSF